jgi:limonene-1,2-epoxide hydrolase
MGEPAESVVRNCLGVLANGNLKVDKILAFFSEDAAWIDGPRGSHQGREAIRAELEDQSKMGFVMTGIEVKSLLADGSTVMMERVDSFTIGGKTFSMEVMAAFEVGADGLITRWRDSYDLKSVTDQIEGAGHAASN